jgi:hypothetical protein
MRPYPGLCSHSVSPTLFVPPFSISFSIPDHTSRVAIVSLLSSPLVSSAFVFRSRQFLITHHRSLTYLYSLSHSTRLALIVAALSSPCEYDFSDSDAYTSHVKFWSLEVQGLQVRIVVKYVSDRR